MNKKNRRTFGYIRRLPSKLYQASYVGQDGHRYYSPMPFVAKADAEGFLASEWITEGYTAAEAIELIRLQRSPNALFNKSFVDFIFEEERLQKTPTFAA